MDHSPRPHEGRTPWTRLHDLVLRHDTKDLITVLAYTAFTGLLALAVPLTAQAVVNTIVAGVFLQPLIILTGLLLGGQLLRGTLRLFKLYLVETLQERIFARVALDVAGRIPRVQHSAITGVYMPEMANRFFDVVTLQKAWAKMLIEGPSMVISILMGSLLLAVYSPYLVAFDVALLLGAFTVMFGFGIGGPGTSIKESKQKYRVAEWLEELGRCHQTLGRQGATSYPVARADQIVCDWLKARRKHFAVLFRQALGNYTLQAIATAGILGIGGWLVIEKKMTIGQLVAAELVVVTVMSAVEKLIRLAEDLYDMVAGADKIGALLDLPIDPAPSGVHCPGRPARVIAQDLTFSHDPQFDLLEGVSFELGPGGLTTLIGPTGSGKTTLALLLAGHLRPRGGRARCEIPDEPEGVGPRIEPLILLVEARRDLFEGTIEENILMGRDLVDPQWLDKVVDLTGLGGLLQSQQGLDTRVESEGWNLPTGIVSRIKLARALLDRPSALVLDEAMGGLSSREKTTLLQAIRGLGILTLLVIENDLAVIEKSSQVLLLQHGSLRALGPGAEAIERGDLDSYLGRAPGPGNGSPGRRRRRGGRS